MFGYYGAKTNIVHLYPPPKFGKIIEPFAGSARYSLKYWDREIMLVDKYEVIVKIWQWLQQCSLRDILKLPRPVQGQTLNDFNFDCAEAKSFMGFIIHFATFSPGIKPSSHYTVRRPNGINYSLQRVASNLHKIKHWNVVHGTYEVLENNKATWFIDPPYQQGGHSYVHSNAEINFKKLASWCKKRKGQVIVCENMKANWLPFNPLKKQRVRTGMHQEAIWSNLATAYNVHQTSLFHL